MIESDPLNDSHSVETIKRRSVRGGIATLLAQLFRFVVQFGSMIVLARILEPGQFGLIAMAAPVLGFVQTINDLGLGQAVVQRAEISRPQVSVLFWVSAAVSASLTVIMLLAAPVFAWLYGEPDITAVIRLLGVLIMVAGLSIIPLAVLNRQMRFMHLALIDTCCVVVGAGAGIAAAIAGLGYWSLVIAQIATSAATLVMAWALAGWWPSWPARAEDVMKLIGFGGYLTGANLATYFTMSADNMLIGAVAGKVALGLYDRSYRLVVMPLTQLMSPISRVAVPMLSRLHAGPRDQFERAYLLMLQLTLAASVPGLLANIFMAEPIIQVVFGEAWLSAAPIFAWICVGGLASSTSASTGWLFTSQGRTREQMFVNISASLINVASFAIGVHWGAVGVAAAGALSFASIQTPLLVWSATRKGAVSAATLGRALVPFVLAGVVAAIVLGLLVPLWQPVSAADIVGGAFIAYAAFAAVLAGLPSGRRFIRSTWGLRGSLQRAA